MMKYMIIAGEVSGDLHAGGLIEGILRRDPEAQLRYFGGEEMRAKSGVEPDVHIDEMNVMGFTAVLRQLPRIARHLRKARELLREFRPDVLVLVDYPSFNLRLARAAKRLGIKVHWYISPKIWAWKQWRIKSIRRYVDRMYSILPFEVEYFKGKDYEVRYVGNPSVHEMDKALKRLPSLSHFLERAGISDTRKVIALIPGSRRSEVRSNLPIMLQAASCFPDHQVIVGGAPSIPLKFYREVAQTPRLQVVFDSTHTLMKHAQAALVTSGTATLETALMGTPQAVCYRANGSRLSYSIMSRLLKVRFVSLPNLIVGREVVPELLLHRCTPESAASCLRSLLYPSPERDRMFAGYKEMRRLLGTQDAADCAAAYIVEEAKRERDAQNPA